MEDIKKQKEELERVMQAINSAKINLEGVLSQVDIKKQELADITSRKTETEEYINSIKGDIFVYKNERDELRAEKQKETLLLENIVKERAKTEMEVFNFQREMKTEMAGLERKRKNAKDEIEIYRTEGEKIVDTAKKRVISIEEPIKALEIKRNDIAKEILIGADKLVCILDKIEQAKKTLPELEAKLKEVETQIKTRVENSELEMKRCAEIGFEKEKGEKELREIMSILDTKTKEIGEAKEQLLRVMDREKKVEETAKRVKALYKRAGIEITV